PPAPLAMGGHDPEAPAAQRRGGAAWRAAGPGSLSAAEERPQRRAGLLGRLLGQEVPAVERPAADVVRRPLAPDAEHVVPARQRPLGAPEDKGRAGDPPAGPGRTTARTRARTPCRRPGRRRRSG